MRVCYCFYYLGQFVLYSYLHLYRPLLSGKIVFLENIEQRTLAVLSDEMISTADKLVITK